jgi:hypothetical protein
MSVTQHRCVVTVKVALPWFPKVQLPACVVNVCLSMSASLGCQNAADAQEV